VPVRRNPPPAFDVVGFGNHPPGNGETNMNSVIYLIGLVVVVLAILSFLGLR
jgi:hypothetical protein